jgi:hypothetical protein
VQCGRRGENEHGVRQPTDDERHPVDVVEHLRKVGTKWSGL